METLPPELKCIIIEKMIQSGDIAGLLSLRLVNYEWFNMIPIDNVVRLKFNTDFKLMKWILKEGNMDMFDYYKYKVHVGTFDGLLLDDDKYDPIMLREFCLYYCHIDEDVMGLLSLSFMTILSSNKHFELLKIILCRFGFKDVETRFGIYVVELIYHDVICAGNLDMLKFMHDYFVNQPDYESLICIALENKKLECAEFIKNNYECDDEDFMHYDSILVDYICDNNIMAVKFLLDNHDILSYIKNNDTFDDIIECCESDEMRQLFIPNKN